MRGRLLGLVFALVPILVFAASTAAPWIAGALAATLIFATLVGPRLDVDVATQRLFLLVAGVLCIAGIGTSEDLDIDAGVHPFWLGTIVASSAAMVLRIVCRRADGGAAVTVALLVPAMVAVGELRSPVVYALGVVAFLGLGLGFIRLGHPERMRQRARDGRTLGRAAAIIGLAGVAAIAITAPIRPAADWFQARVNAAFDEAYRNRGVGFTDSLRVGRIGPMLGSRRVVLRLAGAPVDRVRGVVFDRYERGRFSHATPLRQNIGETPTGPLLGADVTHVVRRGVPSDRLFLPLGVVELSTPGGQVDREDFGVVRATSERLTREYWFRAPKGAVASRRFPPTPHDLEIPVSVAPRIVALANGWSGGHPSPKMAIERIEQRLRRDYSYTLDSDHRKKGQDPILHFLEREKRGHCEYFAAAMMLLARGRGIPARLVAGYLVTERNPITNQYVVREKNAHSWVEVWFDDWGWVTIDPTPADETFASQSIDQGILDALFDATVVGWGEAKNWLASRSLSELGGAVLAGLAIFAFGRWRRARRTASNDDSDAFSPRRRPTEELGLLLDALARRGLARRPSEPLERFARRVDDAASAALLLRHAAWRYGEIRDPGLPSALRARASELQEMPARVG